MKKSELYTLAMEAVLNADINDSLKLEVLEILMNDRHVARLTEEYDEKNQEVAAE